MADIPLFLISLNKEQTCKILPARRGGKMRHRVGESYKTLHELPGQKH